MTALTLEQTNQTLASAGIQLRLTHKGLVEVSKGSIFGKAIAACLKNARARDDVLSILSHYKENPALVHVAEAQMHSQPMLDSQPARSDLDTRQAPIHRQQQSKQPEKTHNQQKAAQQSPQNAPAQQQNTEHADKPNSEPQFVGHHVYGGKSALYFVCDDTRAGDATIAIDGAVATGPRQYNWTQKLRIQITRQDLANVAAVCFGLMPKAELSNYGADNTKRLSLENQGKNFFLNMSAKDYKQIAVPISAEDMFDIRGLFLRQLMANRPEIGVDGILANLKCHAAMKKIA